MLGQMQLFWSLDFFLVWFCLVFEFGRDVWFAVLFGFLLIMKNWVAVWKLFKLQLIFQGRTDHRVYKAYNLSESIQISSGYVGLGSIWDPCNCCVISIGMCQGFCMFIITSYISILCKFARWDGRTKDNMQCVSCPIFPSIGVADHGFYSVSFEC